MEPIVAPKAPEAIGPYSHAIRAGDLLFCSGQTPLDPETMTLVEGDVGQQTEQALANLSAVLKAAGLSLSRVVKTTVFLTDMADFQAMNMIYGHIFGAHRPARSTVAVRQLPMGARVEIECIAAFPSEYA
ncbi:MAG: RidA family protein [Rhodothermaceae bacterium]|nr:RidA family protein [Rhodothermaceae bacterium]